MKIGRYSLPMFRLQPLMEATRKIYEKFPNEEIESQDIAHILELKPTSGGFFQKLADMRSYGLIAGRGKIRVTELGQKITYGETDYEKMEAYRKAVENIPLWKELLSKHDVTLPERDFWIHLKRITGAEPPEAQDKAELVRKAYMDDVKYLKPVEKPIEKAGSGEAIGRSDATMDAMQGQKAQVPIITGTPTLTDPEYGATIQIKDEISYNIAKQILEAMGQRFKLKKQEIREEEKEPKESE